MKRIVINENQEKQVMEMSEFENDSEKDMTALISFLDYITIRLEEINSQLIEIKSFIENDGYAKENEEKLRPFFNDIHNLVNLVDHIYDNIPYE
jgi:hypothetical protein